MTARDREIERALAGKHFAGGFLAAPSRERGRQMLEGIVRRLNAGEPLSSEKVREGLASLSPVGEA